MTKRILIIVIFVIIFNVFVKCQDVMSIPALIRDLTPQRNPDFEIDNSNRVIKGLVNSKLGNDRKPIYSYADVPATYDGHIIIHNQSTFYSWFHDVPGINIAIPLSMYLVNNQSSEDPRIYSYENEAFFPIDGMGWDAEGAESNHTVYTDANGAVHNFHFCLELHARFTYKGGEKFMFKGDDDVWVYINNKLVVDLGAPHDTFGDNGNGHVNLDSLSLKKGNDYSFDFFYCERHSTESHIMMSTSLELKCGYIDYCGVCEGDGSSCCNAKLCDDGDPCTIDSCPSPTAPRYFGQPIKEICQHHPVRCNRTVCADYECNSLTGRCDPIRKLYCAPRDSCSRGVCNEKLGGCTYEPMQCDAQPLCATGQCFNGTCVYHPVNCDDNNECTIDSCEIGVGCIHKVKNCNDNNHCTHDICQPNTGCVYTPIDNCKPCGNHSMCIEKAGHNACNPLECDPYSSDNCVERPYTCDDGNLCTEDLCTVSVVTGKPECTFKPLSCIDTENVCKPTHCNALTGQCYVGSGLNCDDGNPCTVDICSTPAEYPNGTCSHTLMSCDDGNECTVDSCDASQGGCVHTNLTCTAPPDVDQCTIYKCVPSQGCVAVPLECPPPPQFCQTSKCDPIGGCIYYDITCVPDDPQCETGHCNNNTNECETRKYSPLPFKCQALSVKTGVAIGAAGIAGIIIGAGVFIALAVFGGKKGIEALRTLQQPHLTATRNNPLYEPNPNMRTNPLYQDI